MRQKRNYAAIPLQWRFNMNVHYRQIGLSMVELLVALAISSFLILGINITQTQPNHFHLGYLQFYHLGWLLLPFLRH